MLLRPLFAALALIAIPASSFAQITTIGPFTGMASESFETQPQQQFNACLPGRIFNNQGDICTPQGNNAHTTPSWSFICLIFPHTGNLLYGSIGGPSVITLDRPTHRFGAYFGSHNGYADGVAKFHDSLGTLIGTQVITAPANCTWVWNGWHSVSTIGSIEFDSNYPFGGGNLLADSMEVDVIPDPVVYCTAKMNSLGCTPAIGYTGVPRIGACSGFVVSCTNVRNNKNGLLFFGTNGRTALPFQGGTLCVAPPIKRTPAVNSGGTPAPVNDCSGVFSINMNAIHCTTPSQFVPGTIVNVQWWGRDPGFPAPNNTTLSDGLEYTI